MHTLDSIPPEVRLKIFEQYMLDSKCMLSLYIKTSCLNHHPGDDGDGSIIKEAVTMSVSFTPRESRDHTNAFYSELLATNQKIRQEFINYLGSTLHLDVLGGVTPCHNCASIDAISGLLHEPWQGKVKTLMLTTPTTHGLATLRQSLPCGFPTLRKVILPELPSRKGLCGFTTQGRSSYFPHIDQGPLKVAYEAEAAEVFAKCLERYDSTANSHSGLEWESEMKVGSVGHIFEDFGLGRPNQYYHCNGEYGVCHLHLSSCIKRRSG
jgi:hypothetical protein